MGACAPTTAHVSDGLLSIGYLAQRAKDYPQERFTSLSHHLNVEFFGEVWEAMTKRGAVGSSLPSRF